MQVTINIPDELAEKARSRGVRIEAYIEEVLARETRQPAPKDQRAIGEAIDRITELRKGNILGDLTIKDLITEGRKY